MYNRIHDLIYEYTKKFNRSPRYILIGNQESIDLLKEMNRKYTDLYYFSLDFRGDSTLQDLKRSRLYGLKILLVDKLNFLEVVG